MINTDRAKDWIRENIPMLTILFENKYVGMLYDRFASLAPTKQKQVIVGTAGGILAIVMIHLLFSYVSLWSSNSQVRQAQEMVGHLRAFQKRQKEQGADLRLVERNASLATGGALKGHLLAQARSAGISPRMIQADESSGAGNGEKSEGDAQMKRATVKLQRVNLNQLKGFLQNVEFGTYSLDVSSIKIQNDPKIRGYMDVELGVVAILFADKGES
ncbi:hypothetical protein K2X33_04100 [bacterium]|nr:hypothetical protein [bacterium]